MDDQVFLNIVFGVFCAGIGWWCKTMWSEVKSLQSADSKITDRIAAIEVLVAGRYITRDEFQTSVHTLFTKLDRISEQLNGKADR